MKGKPLGKIVQKAKPIGQNLKSISK